MQSIVGGSRLVAETAWERYGGDESADRYCYHRRAAVGERDCADEFADAAVTMLFELLSCWGAAGGERDCADESADAAVTMLFELLGSDEETNLRTKLLPCYLQLLGAGAGERYCGNESAEGAVITCYLSC